jgi:hypothetical protein
MSDGIERLRVSRGAQQVTFAEIADHLFDYCERHPEDAGSVERMADFLVAVEGIPHDHAADPLRGLPQSARDYLDQLG